MWVQRSFRLHARPRGFHLVTREVEEANRPIEPEGGKTALVGGPVDHTGALEHLGHARPQRRGCVEGSTPFALHVMIEACAWNRAEVAEVVP